MPNSPTQSEERKMKNWTYITDENYKIPGKESGDLFSSTQWSVRVYVFLERNTGEIKLFRREYVEKIGTQAIIEELNK